MVQDLWFKQEAYLITVGVFNLDRFHAMVLPEPNSGCWLWMGTVNENGYGQFRLDGKMRRAHRVAYEAYKKAIPEGLTLDHKCRVRCCVNPDHLEPVTHEENCRRGGNSEATKLGDFNRSKTACPKGHPYNKENTMFRKNGNRGGLGVGRVCRVCKRLGRASGLNRGRV